MNIVSVTVSAALMGLISPAISQMALMPIIAQKRAANFGVAESRAVSYAALNEGSPQFTPLDPIAMEGCTVTGDNNINSCSVIASSVKIGSVNLSHAPCSTRRWH